MRRHYIRPLAVLAITLIVVGCSPSPVPSPFALASPTAATTSPAPSPSPVSTPTPTPAPVATPTASPSPSPLTLVWHRARTPFRNVQTIRSAAPAGFAVVDVDPANDANRSFWWSDDGSTWRRLHGVPDTASVPGGASIISGDGTPHGLVALVCASGLGDGGCGSYRIWHSTDGNHWRAAGPIIGLPKAISSDIIDAAPNGHILAALAHVPKTNKSVIVTSMDGLTWQPVPGELEPPSVLWTSIVPAGGGFIAIASEPDVSGVPAVVSTSPDGQTWSPGFQLTGSEDTAVFAVAGGPGYVAAGNGPDGGWVVWTSVDGVQWSRAPDQPSLAGAAIDGLVGTDHGLVAVGRTTKQVSGSGITLWTSADGLTWLPAPGQPPQWASGDGLAGLASDGQQIVVLTNTANGKYFSWTSPLPQ